jgi:ABC-2 type transport system permease protein
MQTLRSLLLGTPLGTDAWLAVTWCLAVTALSYLAARRLLNPAGRRRPEACRRAA